MFEEAHTELSLSEKYPGERAKGLVKPRFPMTLSEDGG